MTNLLDVPAPHPLQIPLQFAVPRSRGSVNASRYLGRARKRPFADSFSAAGGQIEFFAIPPRKNANARLESLKGSQRK